MCINDTLALHQGLELSAEAEFIYIEVMLSGNFASAKIIFSTDNQHIYTTMKHGFGKFCPW